jgi:hypothetical protein
MTELADGDLASRAEHRLLSIKKDHLKKINDGGKGQRQAQAKQYESYSTRSSHSYRFIPPAPPQNRPGEKPEEDADCSDAGERASRFVES